MAARNRPRGAFAKDDLADAHEERNMWSQIQTDIKKANGFRAKAADAAARQVELETKMGKSPTVKQIDELMALYRDGVRLARGEEKLPRQNPRTDEARWAEEEERILREEPSDVIKNIEILVALRSASETEPSRPTTAVNKSRNPKRQKLDADVPVESPAALPSPSIVLPAARIKGIGVGRSGSVPSTREAKAEPSVKVEEGTEGSKGLAGEKAGKFYKGAEVAYKQVKPKEDGSQWIQCNIIGVSEDGKKTRYEVQDPEPEENGSYGQVYKTYATNLIAIPGPNVTLSDFTVGKHVLARYPETTTFYRAEVTGVKSDVYTLRFEDDQDQEMEVYKRFVLDVSSK